MASAALFVAFFCGGVIALAVAFAIAFKITNWILKTKDEKEEEKDNGET